MDITAQLNLDPHLHLKLIQFAEKKASLADPVKTKRIELLLKTKLYPQIEKYVQEYIPNNKNFQQDIKKADQKTNEDIASLGGDATIDDLFDLEDSIKDHQYTTVTQQLFNKSYKLAKIYYDQGNYKQARSILGQLDYFVQKDPYWLTISWGKLNSEILLHKTQNLLESIKKLKHRIQNTKHASTEIQISQKQAFLNLCCFVFFQRNKVEDFETFLDICSEQSYFSTIQMVCPYMLRYMCVAMLLNKSYQRYGKFNRLSLAGALQRNLFSYSDPLTQFMKKLLVKFDFEGAQKALHAINILKQDYFLKDLVDKIRTSSQVLYYQTFCKIYESLPIKSISTFLNKSEQEAEQWIVQLFRQSGMKARIDSITGIIDINRSAWLKSSQSSAIEELIPRTNTIVNNLARILIE